MWEVWSNEKGSVLELSWPFFGDLELYLEQKGESKMRKAPGKVDPFWDLELYLEQKGSRASGSWGDVGALVKWERLRFGAILTLFWRFRALFGAKREKSCKICFLVVAWNCWPLVVDCCFFGRRHVSVFFRRFNAASVFFFIFYFPLSLFPFGHSSRNSSFQLSSQLQAPARSRTSSSSGISRCSDFGPFAVAAVRFYDGPTKKRQIVLVSEVQ